MDTGTMTPKKEHSSCPACGKRRKLANRDNITLCATCHALADNIKNNPQYLEKLSAIAGIEIPTQTSSSGSPVETELPEVLNAVRYRTTDRENNTWYVSVSELDHTPVEIFASTAFDRDKHLQSRISNLTTITRLISLILRHIFLGEHLTLEKTLTQLQRSSRQKNDLPEMLGRVLSNYCKESATAGGKEEQTS